MSFNKANESLTPTGTPTMNSTKRLSTIKTPGSPKTGLKTAAGAGAGAGTGGVKDVVSPGELCGFVRDIYLLASTLTQPNHSRLSGSNFEAEEHWCACRWM